MSGAVVRAKQHSIGVLDTSPARRKAIVLARHQHHGVSRLQLALEPRCYIQDHLFFDQPAAGRIDAAVDAHPKRDEFDAVEPRPVERHDRQPDVRIGRRIAVTGKMF